MEYFHSNSPDDDTNSDTAASPNIFKHLKYNFPPSSHNPLRSLLNFLASIDDDILRSEGTFNVTSMEKEAIEFLVTEGNNCQGGCSILDFQD